MHWIRPVYRIYCLVSLWHQFWMLCWNALISISVFNWIFVIDLRIIRVESFRPYFRLNKLGWTFLLLIVCKTFNLLLRCLKSCNRLFLLWLLILFGFLTTERIASDIILALIRWIVSSQRHASVLWAGFWPVHLEKRVKALYLILWYCNLVKTLVCSVHWSNTGMCF